MSWTTLTALAFICQNAVFWLQFNFQQSPHSLCKPTLSRSIGLRLRPSVTCLSTPDSACYNITSSSDPLVKLSPVFPTAQPANTQHDAWPLQASTALSPTSNEDIISCRVMSRYTTKQHQNKPVIVHPLMSLITTWLHMLSCHVKDWAGISMSTALHHRSVWCQRTADNHLPDTRQELLSQLPPVSSQSLSHSFDESCMLRIHLCNLLYMLGLQSIV